MGGLQIDDRRLLLARRRIVRRARQAELEGFSIPSFSRRTVVYKGLLQAPELVAFYPDLTDSAFTTAIAVFHQRFSTNTEPDWARAQPLRLLAHNGDLQAFYDFHATLMEPWDGPAAVVMSDGRYAGAVLDRNGLRPQRFWRTREYMTGGRVAVLGRAGRNFAAGMSAGTAWVYDEDGDFERRVHGGSALAERVERRDANALRRLVVRHLELTHSSRAGWILDHWDAALPRFWQVTPRPGSRVVAPRPAPDREAVVVARDAAA